MMIRTFMQYSNIQEPGFPSRLVDLPGQMFNFYAQNWVTNVLIILLFFLLFIYVVYRWLQVGRRYVP